MVDVLLPSLHAAFELHGAGPLLTVLSAMSRAHAIKIESTRHGVFVKCHFAARRRCTDGTASTRASSEESVLPNAVSDVASGSAEQFVISDVEPAITEHHVLYREELLQFRHADGCNLGFRANNRTLGGSGFSVPFFFFFLQYHETNTTHHKTTTTQVRERNYVTRQTSGTERSAFGAHPQRNSRNPLEIARGQLMHSEETSGMT